MKLLTLAFALSTAIQLVYAYDGSYGRFRKSACLQ